MRGMIRAAALVIGLGLAGVSNAALVTFHVDPAQSVIGLGPFNNIGNTLQDDLNQAEAQAGGGSASYSGTFEADIVGNTINFLGGPPDVIASTSATLLQPGNAPGNYGIVTLNGKTAAIRDFRFSFRKNDTSQPFDVDAEGHLHDPLQNGDEWAPFLAAEWTRARFGNFPGSDLLYNPPFPAILTRVGADYKLEIPVDIFITWSETSSGDSQFHFQGKIVATSAVPEPGVISLLAAGGALLLSRRRA